MEQMKLLLFILCVWTAEGLIWKTTTISNVSCAGNKISLDWSYTLEYGEILALTEWTKSDGAGGFINVADDLGGFTPAAGYGGRLVRIGNAGIQISDATSSDSGMYRVSLTLASGQHYSVNNSVAVHVAPTSGCSVSVSQSSNTVTCTLNTGSGNVCGTPNLNANWVNFTNASNQFECTVGGIYQCCATSAALTCYSGSPTDFCTKFNCIPTLMTRRIQTEEYNLFGRGTTLNQKKYSGTTGPTTSVTSIPSSVASSTATSNTSANLKKGPTANTTNSTSTSTSPTITKSTNSVSNKKPTNITVESTGNVATIKTSTSSSQSTTSNITNRIKSIQGHIDITVVAAAVVSVPSGLVLIGLSILYVILWKRRCKAGKNGHETPNGMAVLGRDSNVNEWKGSLENGRADDKPDAVYTTPDGLYYQVQQPDPVPNHTKIKTCHDLCYTGGRQYSNRTNGKRLRPHLDCSSRKQEREYYNQYEMTNYVPG